MFPVGPAGPIPPVDPVPPVGPVGPDGPVGPTGPPVPVPLMPMSGVASLRIVAGLDPTASGEKRSRTRQVASAASATVEQLSKAIS